MDIKVGDEVEFVDVIVKNLPNLEGKYKVIKKEDGKVCEVLSLLKDGDDVTIKIAIDCVLKP